MDICIGQQGAAGADDLGAEAELSDGRGGGIDSLAFVDTIGIQHLPGGPVHDADTLQRLREHLAQLVAHRVVHALDIEFAGQRLLHRIDDRELRRALLRFPEQSLRLVEEAGVFKRHAHARCHGRKQSHFGVAKGVLALEVLEADHAEHTLGAEHRNVDGRGALVGPAHERYSGFSELGARREADRLSRGDQS